MKLFKLLITIILFAACQVAKHHVVENKENVIEQVDSLIALSKKANTDELPDSYLDKALFIAQEANNDIALFNIYIFIGQKNRKKSDYGKSLEYLQLAQQLALNLNSDKLKAYATHEIAVNFRRIDDQATALRYHIQALEWAENANDTFLIHCSLNGIGNVYFSYNDWEKSIEYFHRSLDYLGKVEPNLLGEAINTNTLGEAWLKLGNTDSALHYLERSLQINFLINSELGQAICFNGLGMVYHKKSDYKNAIKAYNSALEMYEKIGDMFYETMCLNNLAKTYQAINKSKKAEQTFKKSYNIASAIGSKSFALEAALELAKLYKNRGDADLSFYYQDLSMQYKDSITDELRQQNADAMKVLYESEKQKREMLEIKQAAELTKIRLNRQKYLFLAIAILLAILVVFVVFAYRHRQLRNKITSIGLEQRLLRAQLNPHFIFNSLSAIQNFIVRNNKQAASQYLVNFSRLMRNILMGTATEFISLSDELEILDDYLTLQKLRYQDRFDFFFEIDDEIHPSDCLIPAMLIQPFVENSVEHGVRFIDYQGNIFVRFQKKQQKLIIQVEDNGLGLQKQETKDSKEKKKKYVSMATKITRRRLQNIEATYKQKCSFSIKDKKSMGVGTGVLVSIEIPYQTDA